MSGGLNHTPARGAPQAPLHQPSFGRFNESATAAGEPERALETANAFLTPDLQLADHDAVQLHLSGVGCQSELISVIAIQLLQTFVIHPPGEARVGLVAFLTQAHRTGVFDRNFGPIG